MPQYLFLNFHILVDLLKAPDLSLLLSSPLWHSNGYNLSGHVVEVSEFLVLRYCTNVSLLVKLSLPEAKPADPFVEHLPHQSRMCHFYLGWRVTVTTLMKKCAHTNSEPLSWFPVDSSVTKITQSSVLNYNETPNTRRKKKIWFSFCSQSAF